MYKSFTSLFLLFLLLVAWIKPAIPFIEYELNKYYIQKNLCEKKEIPENSCKGKCHLRKQIKKINKQNDDNNVPLPPKVNSEDYPIFVLVKYEKSNFISRLEQSCSQPFEFYKYQFVISIFHPPKEVVFF